MPCLYPKLIERVIMPGLLGPGCIYPGEGAVTRCTANRRPIDQRHARTLLRQIVGNARPHDTGTDDRDMTPIALSARPVCR